MENRIGGGETGILHRDNAKCSRIMNLNTSDVNVNHNMFCAESGNALKKKNIIKSMRTAMYKTGRRFVSFVHRQTTNSWLCTELNFVE